MKGQFQGRSMRDELASPPICPILGGSWPHFTGVPNWGGQEWHEGVHIGLVSVLSVQAQVSPRMCPQEGGIPLPTCLCLAGA